MDPTRNDNDELVGLEFSLDRLPLECLRLIISYVHFRHWPQIELVNRRLRAGVLANWSMMKEAHLEEYCGKKIMSGQMTRKEVLQVLLPLIFTRSPHVRSIRGFSIRKWPQYYADEEWMQLDLEIMMKVAAFPRLRSITFAACKILVKDLAIFLAESSSRAVFEELCIFDRNVHSVITTDAEDEEMMRKALIDVEGRPSLRLKSFRLSWNRPFPSNFPALLNTSRLQVFAVVNHAFQPAEMTELLSRCTRLEELRIDIVPFIDAGGQWITTFSSGLKALPSRELRRFGLFRWDNSMNSVAAEILTQLAKKYPKLELLDLPVWWSGDDLVADSCIVEVIGKRCKLLEELHLDIGGFSEESITQLVGRLGQLKRLSLTDNDRRFGLFTCVIAEMASSLAHLTSLHLDIRTISSDDASMLLRMKKLKELSIGFLSGSEGSIPVCQQLAPILVSLYLHQTNIDDQLLMSAIGNRITGIRRLSLRYVDITDASLHVIAHSCPLIEELDVTGCYRITGAVVKRLIDECKKLKRIKVNSEIHNIGCLVKDAPISIDWWPETEAGLFYGCERKWWSW